MHAFILAGGFATRLWPLTEKRAKPLLPLAGKPIITHIIEKIPTHIPITISTNAVFQDDFLTWKKNIGKPEIEILIEDTKQERQKLGALGATARWIECNSIEDDILLLAGDNYFGFPITDIIDEFQKEKNLALFAARKIASLEDAKRFGVIVQEPQEKTQQGKIKRHRALGFIEKPVKPPSDIVSTGCIVLPKNILPVLVAYAREHPDDLGGILHHLIHDKKEKVDYILFDAPWFDIGSFEAYLEASQSLVPTGKPVIHSTTNMDAVTMNNLRGSIVIGAGTSVTNAHLSSTIVFDNCTIDNCVLERCILDTGCTLSNIDLTGKMLRAGTVLVRKPFT